MEVHFKPEVQARIARLAAEHQSDPDTYVQQLVESVLEHDFWFRGQVQQGLDQLDRGEYLTHEQVGARLEELLRS